MAIFYSAFEMTLLEKERLEREAAKEAEKAKEEVSLEVEENVVLQPEPIEVEEEYEGLDFDSIEENMSKEGLSAEKKIRRRKPIKKRI